MISMLPLLNAGTDGIGTCQKRILGNVLRGVTALPRQCGSSRLPGSNSPPSSRAPGRNRPLCRRHSKIIHRPPAEKLHNTRVGSSCRSQLTMRITDAVRPVIMLLCGLILIGFVFDAIESFQPGGDRPRGIHAVPSRLPASRALAGID